MPDDFPLDPAGSVKPVLGDERTPHARLWNVYLVAIVLAVAVAVLYADEFDLRSRVISAGAMAGIAVLHVAAGRRVIERDRQGPALMLAELALFAVAVALVPVANWLLFGAIPLIFQLVVLRTAVVLVVLANAVLPVSDLVLRRGGVGMDIIVALISSVAGVWLGFWITRVMQQSQERRRLIEELENSRAEVARLSRDAGVMAERERLAGEIHDTLAQGFTSIITLLQAADPALRDERLALAVRTARENLAEARGLVTALSPTAPAPGSLPSAVRRQVLRFAEESGVTAGLRVSGEERPLPTAIEVVLLRAAQESLTNVRRHASAREAAVLLAYTPSAVRLVVRDDGSGFVPGEADGYGLAGMRARAEQVSGRVQVRSDPDTGTTVEVEVPA